MNKELLKLEQKYLLARQICDPIEFAQRQKNLVNAICDVLLKPLNDIEEKERKEASESLDKFLGKR